MLSVCHVVPVPTALVDYNTGTSPKLTWHKVLFLDRVVLVLLRRLHSVECFPHPSPSRSQVLRFSSFPGFRMIWKRLTVVADRHPHSFPGKPYLT